MSESKLSDNQEAHYDNQEAHDDNQEAHDDNEPIYTILDDIKIYDGTT